MKCGLFRHTALQCGGSHTAMSHNWQRWLIHIASIQSRASFNSGFIIGGSKALRRFVFTKKAHRCAGRSLPHLRYPVYQTERGSRVVCRARAVILHLKVYVYYSGARCNGRSWVKIRAVKTNTMAAFKPGEGNE